jgi:hypothetical protein
MVSAAARPADVNTLRAVMEGPAMLELLDYPTTFPLLWDIMGWIVPGGNVICEPPSIPRVYFLRDSTYFRK